MTSQLNVDTIVDKAGSGGTNVKIGNTSVTVAEGGSTTTTTVQGLAKVFSLYAKDGTSKDGFNVASITDNDSGQRTVNFTNNMSNTTYIPSQGQGDADSATSDLGAFTETRQVKSTSAAKQFSINSSDGSNFDGQDDMSVTIHGDLA